MKNNIIRPFLTKINSLTPSEKLLVDFFNTFEKNNFSLTQKEMSKKLFISEATISRFVKKYNFESYKLFSIWYNQKIIEFNTKYILLDNEEKQSKNRISNILMSHKYTIDKALNINILKLLQKLSKDIIKAERVVCYGINSSYFASNNFSKNLERIRIPILSPNNFHDLIPIISSSNKNDLFIFCSNNFDKKELLFAYNKIKKMNAKIALITTNSNNLKRYSLNHLITYEKIHNKSFYTDQGV